MGKRLFIAADISMEARAAASGLIQSLRAGFSVKGVGWVQPENLHITIKFLGDTSSVVENKLLELLERIANRCNDSFTLKLDGPEVLGKRVLSIKVTSDTPTIFALEQQIDVECESLGYKREGRRFHPHVTVARIRDPRSAYRVIREFGQMQIPPVKFEVRELVLYESTLTPAGSVYNSVAVFKLGS